MGVNKIRLTLLLEFLFVIEFEFIIGMQFVADEWVTVKSLLDDEVEFGGDEDDEDDDDDDEGDGDAGGDPSSFSIFARLLLFESINSLILF